MTTHIDLIITIGSLAAMMWAMMKFMLRDIHKDLTDIRSDIGDLRQAQKRSEERIDHLYHICIEILTTRK